MKSFVIIFFLSLVLWIPATASAASPQDRYFLSSSEFSEIQAIASEESFENPTNLSRLPDGKIISEVGFNRYERREYRLAGSKSLSIEVVTLLDLKASYSLLTLLGDSSIQTGPPGDEYSANATGIQFAHRNMWVNIRSKGVDGEFIRKVAEAVSRKLGSIQKKSPELVSHFPQNGYSASTLRYFPNFKSFEIYSKKVPAWMRICGEDMEIARANYTIGGKTTVLSLLNYPTSQIAEAYYSKFAASAAAKVHSRNVGPIIAVIEGPVEPESAEKLLRDIRYDYSIQWIYEKKESKASNLFGIPINVIDKLIKKSFFFVGLIALLSIGAGIAFAVFRFRFRNRVSKSNMDDGDITHLKMR
jgi:hypothetical protein